MMDAVIIDAIRTPIGALGGSLSAIASCVLREDKMNEAGTSIEFLIMLGILGMLTYELLSSEVINEKSVRRVISRNKRPGLFWFVVGFQLVVLIWMLLELLRIVDILKW